MATFVEKTARASEFRFTRNEEGQWQTAVTIQTATVTGVVVRELTVNVQISTLAAAARQDWLALREAIGEAIHTQLGIEGKEL